MSAKSRPAPSPSEGGWDSSGQAPGTRAGSPVWAGSPQDSFGNAITAKRKHFQEKLIRENVEQEKAEHDVVLEKSGLD